MLAVVSLLSSVGALALPSLESEALAEQARPTQEVWVHPRPVVLPATRSASSAGPVASFLTTNGPVDADMPREVVLTPDGAMALIVHRDTDNLVFFDLATRTVTDVVDVGDFPVDVAIAPNGVVAVTTNVLSNDVSVVDIATRTKLADVPITGLQPFAVEITPNSRRAVVAVINDGIASSFSVVNLVTLSEASSFPSTPQGVLGFFGTPESGIFGNLFTQFALSPDGTTIVLPDRGNAQVTIYDRISGSVRATLPTAALPSGVDISADNLTAVVSHESTAQAVSVIDLSTDTLTSSHATGVTLNNRLIRLTLDASHAICSISNNVIFVNVASGALTATISTGSPGDIEISFDGQYAFVSNFNSRLIDIASQTVVRTLTLAPSYETAVSPSSLRAVALNNRFREDIHVYDISGAAGFVEGFAITGPPPEGDAARTADISGNGLVAVVAHNTSRSAAVIDLVSSSVRAWIDTGDRCLGVAVAPDGQSAVVCNGDEDTVSILDLTNDTLALNLPVVQRPAEVLISPDSQTAYVTTVAGTDRVHFIQLAGAASSITGSLVTGQMGSSFAYAYSGISGMTLSADGSLLGVCISFDDQLMIVDTLTQTELARVAVGDFPYRMTFSPSGSRAWVLNTFGDSVTVVDVAGAASTAVATVPGIDTPSTVDYHAGAVYVANAGTPSVLVVIDATTHAVLASVPLPIRVREAYMDGLEATLYLAGADTGGVGQLVRVQAAGASTAIIDQTPLSGSPADLVFSEPLDRALATQPVPDGVDIVRFPIGKAFCDASDGSLGTCPCTNPGDADTGCDIPQATGGVALSVLSQDASPNGATLLGTGFATMGAPTAIVIRSDSLDPGSPVVFGDGLRCVNSTPLVRLAAVGAVGGVSTHTFGHGAVAGSGTFFYQIWFRSNPSTFCDPSAAFNLSNGRTLSW